MHAFTYRCTTGMVHSCLSVFMCSCLHLFIPAFIYAYIYSFVCAFTTSVSLIRSWHAPVAYNVSCSFTTAVIVIHHTAFTTNHPKYHPPSSTTTHQNPSPCAIIIALIVIVAIIVSISRKYCRSLSLAEGFVAGVLWAREEAGLTSCISSWRDGRGVVSASSGTAVVEPSRN